MDTPNSHTSAVPQHSARNRTASDIKKHRIVACLIAVAVLLCVWLLVHLFSKPKAKPAGPPPIPVATAPVALGNVDVYLDALGTVTPVYTVTVVSRVAGEITEVRFKEGQRVKKNDLLAVIDPRPYVGRPAASTGTARAATRPPSRTPVSILCVIENSYKEHAIPEQQLATQQATVDQDEGTVKLDPG